jgi:hypothetical protein
MQRAGARFAAGLLPEARADVTEALRALSQRSDARRWSDLAGTVAAHYDGAILDGPRLPMELEARLRAATRRRPEPRDYADLDTA